MVDTVSDNTVNATDWRRSEVTLYASPDAETISLGVLSSGAGTVWVKDISLLITSGRKGPVPASEPANLKFSESPAGVRPQGWRILPDSDTTPTPYKAEGSARGGHLGGTCAALE